MSDDEDVMRSDEEEGSDEETAEDSGPSEAQKAMQRRKDPLSSVSGMDEAAQELLAANKEERAKLEDEIAEMRARNERRKREREEEERELTKRRQEEDQRRKAEEEDRKRQKEEAEQAKRDERASKMAQFEKWKNPPKPNFVITKRESVKEQVSSDEEPHEEKKSKEQLEAEKRAILGQRVQPLNIAGFDSSKLTEKAKELYNLLVRLESEKYDLDKRFKAQQYDMMELAERARQMNKIGKQDDIKRIQLAEDESDKVQERFAGCPARIVMYSEYERQKDPRGFVIRRDLYKGPVYGFPAERIRPERIVQWNEEGQPIYAEDGGEAPAAE